MHTSVCAVRQPLPITAAPFRKSLLCCACSLVMMGISHSALANQQEQETGLDTMVITADWLDLYGNGDLQSYPGARSKVESEELHKSGALNLEDALRSIPGVQVLDETGTGILPNIGIRGLNPLRSERVQMLVDGYPIAIGPYTNVGVSLFPVTLPSIEAVDIVRGGAAVHYGPNNVGGVLNMITRPIPEETRQTLRERLIVSDHSGNLMTDTYYKIGGAVNDQLKLQFQANIQSGEGFRDHSDTDVSNFIIDAEYQPNERHQIDAMLQHYNVEAELPGALTPQAYRDDRTQSQRPYDAYDADMLRGTLTWSFTPSDDTQFEWRNFAHDADRAFDFGQRLGTGDHWADPGLPSTHVADSPRLFKVYGTEPRITTRQGDHTLTVGARFIKEKVEFDVNRLELATDSYSAARDWGFETDAYAVYASDSILFLDDRLTVTPGIRYEHLETDFDDNLNNTSDQNKADEVLPGLTLSYAINDQWTVFTNGQRSLVPVQTAQVTRGGDVANETAWNYELGLRFADINGFSGSATAFRINHEDKIEYNSGTSSYQNIGETRHEGIELAGNWQIDDQWILGMSYTYLDTEQMEGANEGNELPNAPHHHLSADITYNHQQWQAKLSTVYVSDSFSDAANTESETANGSAGELPSYTLVNAYVSRDINVGNDRTLSLGFGINNLLDEEYYFRGVDVSPVGRLPAPGRSFMLDAGLTF